MSFLSILFKNVEDYESITNEMPEFFRDLNLDKIIDGITAGRERYNLKPYFYTPLRDVDAIRYRQEIMKDLEDKVLFDNIKSFSQKMIVVQEHLGQAQRLYNKYQKESWFLDAVEIYCDAVNTLLCDLTSANLNSQGFISFREYLKNYVESNSFRSLFRETKKLKDDLSVVKYCILIKGNCVKVRKYMSEIDYSKEVIKTFERFKQNSVKDYTVQFSDYPEMNHIEAQILDFVAKLYLEIFSHLDNYSLRNANFIDETIAIFDKEIQFYISYLEFIEKLKKAGLKFCYPQISDKIKEVYNFEGFDMALAYKLVNENQNIVCNDFYLKGEERIIVVTGPNQGGKTTFARAFGQIHFLAGLGCPVPGKRAQLFLYDRIFTHFEKEENIKDLRGKLEDELLRIRYILEKATPNSVIIINEIFTSTTLKDAIFLSKKIMEKILQKKLLCVWVTFVYELAVESEKIVSMVSSVNLKNPAIRTYKILRKVPDGFSYAMSIAEKYRLTYNLLKERIRS
ncbi:MutS domain V [Caldanaerovirga acetigignens]|uniref:MutS domain V n=1 Tax=Caldanaerovirga acetigignens TaxID=447595 RepID=A0A1M7JYX3_9FIRM|nr:hypothetical protein [Caldanaerovirga acetigignens]SHM58226.1 MutS domain V [Caldanaerovirga acetigignens]